MRVPYSPTKSKPSLGQRLLHVDLPQDWRCVNQHTPGYCYLCLYEEEHHQKVASLLRKYPDWLKVRTLGGFKETGSFSTMRARNDVVHISTDGIGVPARDLRMHDKEILGAQLEFSPGYILNTWPLAILIWYIRIYYLNVSWETTLPMLFVSAMLISPPWVMMVLCGRVLVPTPKFVMKVISNKFRNLEVVRPCVKSWHRYVPMILFAFLTITTTDAKLSLDVDHFLDQIEGAKPDEIKEIREFHPRYMEAYEVTRGAEKMCLQDYEIRGEALDLQVEDDILIQYLELLCQPLKGLDNWHDKVKAIYLGDSRCELAKYAKPDRGYIEQITDTVSDEAVVFMDAAGELAQDTLEGGKRLMTSVNERQQELSGNLIGQTDAVLQSANKALTGTARGLNKALERRAGRVEPLINDLDSAVEIITGVIPSATDMAKKLKSRVESFNNEVEVKLEVVSVVNKIWEMGSRVAMDANEIGDKIYKQSVDRLNLQLDNTEVDENTKPLTIGDLVDATKAAVNGVISTSENIGHYVHDVYTENNVKENTGKLIEEAPWLTKTIGETIGNLPNGIMGGSGVSETVTNFVKDLREATIGAVDTPEQRDRKRELRAQIELERAKSRGNVLNMFRRWSGSSKPIREKKKK